ncbi:hypothetical protein HHL19_16320 [Streptomyces sp. R302]|uniref:hypothetical protein n=1 Tax=unclassified Streptomyces TaxID=2593676 RepID=UPI00145EDFF3|nr:MULTISPECIES: hypothetical protein [unclassified Streptomyces]NML55336.1 hypothetical protein [Streptomyces sp. R301]NML80208.1 hypothetical protein [Streptomyces sp. R302]
MTQHDSATYLPPAKYTRSDNAQCCPHATPVAPGSCPYCWELHQAACAPCWGKHMAAIRQPSPTAELRSAAQTLRRHADEAQAAVDTNPYWQSTLVDRSDWYTHGVRGGLGGPSGELAALMHPGTGHVLAQWLDAEAGHLDHDGHPALHEHALAVARAINRSQP